MIRCSAVSLPGGTFSIVPRDSCVTHLRLPQMVSDATSASVLLAPAPLPDGSLKVLRSIKHARLEVASVDQCCFICRMESQLEFPAFLHQGSQRSPMRT